MISVGFKGGNYAKIIIHDKAINFNQNESGNFRGLHLVIINQLTGKIEKA